MSSSVSNKNQAYDTLEKFDSLFSFNEIDTDTLHITVMTYVHIAGMKTGCYHPQFAGVVIPSEIAGFIQNQKTNNYTALGKFNFDKEKKYTGYLIGNSDSTGGKEIDLFVFSKTENKFIFNCQVASYLYLKGTTEQIMNSWIMDLNNDKCLDIATISKITDFEKPNEFSDNISGEKKWMYYFREGIFEYRIWDENLLNDVKVMK
ncbi:MAG: hypothetical protein V1904_08630 [Bacteroidota bacterium]